MPRRHRPGDFRPSPGYDGRHGPWGVRVGRNRFGPPSHHLLAYSFDGQTFLPVARRALTEMHTEFTEAELRDIVDGVIELVLHVPQPDDPRCCPSGRTRASFVLGDQRLVDAGKDRPGA